MKEPNHDSPLNITSWAITVITFRKGEKKIPYYILNKDISNIPNKGQVWVPGAKSSSMPDMITPLLPSQSSHQGTTLVPSPQSSSQSSPPCHPRTHNLTSTTNA